MALKQERVAPAKRRPDQEITRLDGSHPEYSPAPALCARLTLRSIVSDDGHFQGLEVAR